MSLLGTIAGVALGPVGSIINGIVGSNGQKKINNQNIALTREMWDKQVDFINEQNEYNSPLEQRRRLEEAGYNPYLNQVSTGLASSTPSVQVPTLGNAGAYLGQGISGAANSFYQSLNSIKQASATDAQTAATRYNLDRLIQRDNVHGSNGVSAIVSDGLQSVEQARLAHSQANISAAEEVVSKLNSAFFSSQAVDDAGNPVTDVDGNPVSNYDYREQGHTRSVYKTIDKLNADIINAAKQGKILDVDLEVKQFERDHLQPAQLDAIRQGIVESNSRIRSNNASAAAAYATAYSTTQSGLTTNALRPFVVGKASWDNQLTKYGALSSKSDYLGSGSYGEWFDKQPSWIKWTVNAARGLAPVFGGAANAGSAYRSFKR